MFRWRKTLALVFASLLLLLDPASLRSQQRNTAEQYLFDQVNAARKAAGLSPLAWSESLNRAAAVHADWMRKEDAISHKFDEEADLPERAAAVGSRFTMVAENVGLAESAINLQSEFMSSTDHRENILDARANSIGISVREANGELWVVEDFAREYQELSLEDQERKVATQLNTVGMAQLELGGAARDVCRMASGYTGGRPAYVLRYTSAELDHLPAQLSAKLKQGGFRDGAVGACTPRETGNFDAYRIAVVLYR